MAVGAVNRDLPHRSGVTAGTLLEPAEALEPLDLVLLEQPLDAAGERADDAVLARQQLLQIELDRPYADAVVAEAMLRLLEVLARLQQRLRGDAADIEAGAAKRQLARGRGPALDARGAQAQLRRADGSDIAARSTPDDDDVEVSHSRAPSNLEQQARRVFQRILDGDQAQHRLATVDDAMVVRER